VLLIFFFGILCKYNPPYWIFGYFELFCEAHSFWSQEVAGCVTSMPHIDYGNVVFSTIDSASQRRINVAFNSCLHYVHDILRREHVSHLVLTMFSVRIHLLTFLCKVSHIKHPCDLLRFFISLLRHVLRILLWLVIGLLPWAIHSKWRHLGLIFDDAGLGQLWCWTDVDHLPIVKLLLI
jgi:hypothetical protein